MSELISIWKNSDLTGATLPPPFPIPNNPSARTIQINNQSRYWLIISQKNTGLDALRIEPFSYQTLPMEPDLLLRIDTDLAKTISSLTADNEFVDYSAINGIIAYQKGSTQFSGSQTVDVSQAQISMTANNVTVNNSGVSAALQDASGTITTASSSQQILIANTNRKYLLFQNLSDTDMYINFNAAATLGNAGSIWVAAYGGSIEYENLTCPSDTLNVICSASGKAYTCKYV